MAAIGAEELDLLVAKFLVVTIEFAVALRAGHPKDFRHSSVPRICSRQDAKAQSLGTKSILKNFSLLPWRLCAFAGESSSPHSDLFRAKHARLILTPPPPRSLAIRCRVKDHSLHLRHTVKYCAWDEIFEPRFLHRRFRHGDARFIGSLNRLRGVDDHLSSHDVVGLRRVQ